MNLKMNPAIAELLYNLAIKALSKNNGYKEVHLYSTPVRVKVGSPYERYLQKELGCLGYAVSGRIDPGEAKPDLVITKKDNKREGALRFDCQRQTVLEEEVDPEQIPLLQQEIREEIYMVQAKVPTDYSRSYYRILTTYASDGYPYVAPPSLSVRKFARIFEAELPIEEGLEAIKEYINRVIEVQVRESKDRPKDVSGTFPKDIGVEILERYKAAIQSKPS